MERSSRVWLACSAIFLLCGATFLALSPFLRQPSPSRADLISDTHAFRAARSNVFADLDDDEVSQVLAFVHSGRSGLNLTSVRSSTAWDNHVISVEALPPPKSATLPYLDGKAEAPDRWARLVVSLASDDDPRICEYEVGPLPVSDETSISPLTKGHAGGKHCIHNPFPNFAALGTWFSADISGMSDVIIDLLGEVLREGDRGTYGNVMLSARRLRNEDGRLMMWTSVHSIGDAWSLLPQGLYLQLDITSRNQTEWQILKCYYNGKLYNSTKELRAAWESPGFEKSKLNLNGGWADPEEFDSDEPGRDKLPPVMIQPEGPRYNVDPAQRFVSWMGFEFYISTRSATGVTLYDIRFKGERIMYELGLQEALAHYAGDNPMQSGQLWLDSFFGMGLRMFELVPGYDCPAYATFFNSTFSWMEDSWANENSICVFEYTADYPLSRHTTNRYVSISRNTYLVVRSVSTVGNYDYTIEYYFYLDGTIEVKVHASGYIFSAFYDAPAGPDQGSEGEDEYGYRVHDVVSGSMHDHVINFKADMDIAGTANTMVRVDIEPMTRSYAWDDGLESPRNTMHLHTVPVSTEAGLDWPRNSQAMYIVLNNDSRNAWGEKRGYRITPGTGMGTPPHLAILNSTSLEKASEWASHDLWVLKQKDSEPRSANERNALEPGSPLVKFSDFVDGDEISQEDLVIYFNLGAHHIPHSGDIPNTLEHTSATSVMFVPHNFHDRDPSRSTVQGVRIDLDPKGNKARYFGRRYEEDVSLAQNELEPDLSTYKGTPHGLSSADLAYNDSAIGMGIQPGYSRGDFSASGTFDVEIDLS